MSDTLGQMVEAGIIPTKKLNGYIVYIENQKPEEVWASTTKEAWDKARALYKGHKRHPEIDVFLTVLATGEDYVHTAVN